MQRILADDVIKSGIGHLFLQFGKRIDRINNALAVNFHAGCSKPLHTADRQSGHFKTVFGIFQTYTLVRRIARRQKNDALQFKFAFGTGSHFDMPYMDGIKTAAHNADSFLWHVCASFQQKRENFS